jgi:hypothetical protein
MGIFTTCKTDLGQMTITATWRVWRGLGVLAKVRDCDKIRNAYVQKTRRNNNTGTKIVSVDLRESLKGVTQPAEGKILTSKDFPGDTKCIFSDRSELSAPKLFGLDLMPCLQLTSR